MKKWFLIFYDKNEYQYEYSVFHTLEDAKQSIIKLMDAFAGTYNLSDFHLIEGVHLELLPVKVVTKIKIGGEI